LIGVNVFADGLAGKGSKTRARINDFFHTQKFASLQSDNGRFNLMRTLGRMLLDIAERFPKVEFEVVFAGHTHSPAPMYRPVTLKTD
jgi:hypothetical protein